MMPTLKISPFFSIIIPCYNRLDSLRECLKSVVAQNFTNFEVLVVDDGSTEDVESVVMGFGDRRLNYYKVIHSGSPAIPRNLGLVKASGDWICFLDSDDAWTDNKLLTVHNSINLYFLADFVAHNELIVNKILGHKHISRLAANTKNFYHTLLEDGNKLSTSAVIIKRDFLNRHNLKFNISQSFHIVEDYDLWLQCARHGAKFLFINKSLGFYFINDGNISNNYVKATQNLISLLESHALHPEVRNSKKTFLCLHIRVFLLHARLNFYKRNYFMLVFFICRAVGYSPRYFFVYTLKRLFDRLGTKVTEVR